MILFFGVKIFITIFIGILSIGCGEREQAEAPIYISESANDNSTQKNDDPEDSTPFDGQLIMAVLDGMPIVTKHEKNLFELDNESLTALANGDDIYAQWILGQRYAEGKSFKKNDEKAAQWFLKSARNEKSTAFEKYHVGTLFFQGKGVSLNKNLAAVWFQKSADEGFPWALFQLAQMRLIGDGVLENRTEAFNLMSKAANMGYPAAQSKLAGLYILGEGVKQNFEMAFVWANFASANGFKPAKTFKDGARKMLNPLQLESAQEKAGQMQKQNPQLIGWGVYAK